MKTGWILSLALIGAPLAGSAALAEDATAPTLAATATAETASPEAAAKPSGGWLKTGRALSQALLGAPLTSLATTEKDASDPVVQATAAETDAVEAQPLMAETADDDASLATNDEAPAPDMVLAADETADTPAPAESMASEDAPAAAADQASAEPNNDGKAWEIEYSVWKAASDGGEISDYEAYLEAYPSGHFSGIARNRIVKLTEADTAPLAQGSADPQADQEAAMASDEATSDMPADMQTEANTASEPQVLEAAIKPRSAAPQNLQSETMTPPALTEGTPEEEAALLDRPARREMQGRLTSLGFSTRGVDGAFGPRSRAAISDWQMANQAPVSGYLSGDQIALIRQQSAETYAQWLAAQPRRAARPRTVVRRVYRDAPPPRNDAAAAAVFGLAAGAIIGTAAARAHRPHRRYYRRPRWRRW